MRILRNAFLHHFTWAHTVTAGNVWYLFTRYNRLLNDAKYTSVLLCFVEQNALVYFINQGLYIQKMKRENV